MKECPLDGIMKPCYDNCSDCLRDEEREREREKLNMNIHKVGSNTCGETLYRVFLGTGTLWLAEFHVYAYSEQEAIDLAADYCEEQELEGLYADHYEIYDLCEAGQTVDEYAEEHGLYCCGNHGIYVKLEGIEVISE